MSGEIGAGDGSEDGDGNSEQVAEAVKDMIREGFIDELVHRYEHRLPKYAPLVEDVIHDQVEHLVVRARTERIRDPRALLLWRVKRRVLDLTDRPPGRYGESTDGEDWESPEAIAERNELFRAIKALVGRWPNRRMRIITSLYLDARFYGEYLSVSEARDLLLEQYGEDMTPNNISKTLGRGMQRLGAEVTELLATFEQEEAHT